MNGAFKFIILVRILKIGIAHRLNRGKNPVFDKSKLFAIYLHIKEIFLLLHKGCKVRLSERLEV